MIGNGDKMKRIGGKSFWIILIISIVCLILLIFGTIFLTRTSAQKFYSAGYIISSNASKTDKYYFNDNTVYKENVFEEYIFKDVNNKEVSTSKDNFIHYLDNSLSFMKKGVILDLDNLNTSLVPYYNITDKSLIKYNNGSYYIENSDKTLIFNNFLGRITENKYIVVGNAIEIKLAGNDNSVKGDYFEILFIEDGIVKIENQEGSYQTVSSGTVIYIGEDIKIDLGEKTVLYEDETRLTLNEMTIDGNENIDIKPSDGKADSDSTDDNGNDNSEGNNSGNGDDNQGENNGTGNGNQNSEGEHNSVIKKEVSVDLITAKVGINDISASFQVIDTDNFIKGNLILTLTNTTTGEIVYTKLLAKVSELQDVSISSLSPDCNYVMTVYEDSSGNMNEYFKKNFRTESLDLKLIREIVTKESLSYSLDFGTNSEIKSANVSLFDETNTQVGQTYTINNSGDNFVVFDGLTKNTTYRVVVDSVIFNNTNYANIYTINTSDTTLKEKPVLGTISVETDNENQIFKLSARDFEDIDNSITKYTYEIYKAEDLTLESINRAEPIYTFSKDKLEDVTLKIGENNLVGKQNYRYKIIVEYYDNYKYNEIETGYSDNFIVLGKPSIEFIQEIVDFNQIVGIVKLKDDSCTVPIPGRECFDETNTFTIRYSDGITSSKRIDNVNFDKETLEYRLSLNGLTENTTYTFEVYGTIDLHDGTGKKEDVYIGSFVVKTSGIEALKMQNWKQNASTFDIPVAVSTEMVSTSPESDYGEKLASIKFNLYRGDVKNGIQSEPIATFEDNEDIKTKYYNKEFQITSKLFGIENLNSLRELSGGKLSRYYTIEITDAFDADKTNEFTIIDNMFVFETPSILLLEDEVEMPTIIVEEITNEQLKSNEYNKKYSSSLGDNIIVGYQVTASFDKNKIESYFQGSNPITKLNFYAYDNKGSEVKKIIIDLTQDKDIYEAYFFLDNGTDFNTIDTDMRRGNTYTFAYDMSIDSNNDGTDDTVFPSTKPTSEPFTSLKQDPTFNMYIDSSSPTSITYKYKITDIDNALYKEADAQNYHFYYKINDLDDEYQSVIMKEDDFSTFTVSNLVNSSTYTLSYYRANSKRQGSISKITMGKYFFDGYYDLTDYNLGYRLEYGNFDNRLKIVIDDNEFIDRISAYLVRLENADNKYEQVVTDLQSCDENKCIIIDYADIESFKGKDITVTLQAFYDTGFIGFSQPTKLGVYLKDLGLVEAENMSKVGYVYQMTNTEIPGQYVYIESSSYLKSNTPKGILGFNLRTNTNPWYLTTTNLVDIKNNKFVPYGTIIKENDKVKVTQNGIIELSDSVSKATFNPKVLDIAEIQTSNNQFKFTSITPKVSTTSISLINGAIVDIELSVSEETLATDFVQNDGKYKFYIDIYSDAECSDENFVKTVETDYENLKNVTFEGLNPDTEYYYKISADMNKNGSSVKTPLFDYNRSGYVEYKSKFKTLGKDEIFSRIDYNYNSEIFEELYSKRTLNILASLKTNTNMNIRFELYDINGDLEYEKTIANADIYQSSGRYVAKYVEDITGDTFVFGENYHTLKIYAVTTDLNLELELYNALLKNVMGGDIGELINPTFTVTPNAIIEESSTGDYTYGITYNIVVQDEDRVIEDGIYEIELQDAAYNNACPGREEQCRRTIDIKKSGFVITETFTNLEPDTNYVIYISAKTYRNNASLEEKEGIVYVRKSQYTKNKLNFSLGAVTPTATSKKELVITFTGASNLEKTLKKLDYNITVQGGERVASGSLQIGQDTNFKLDKDGYPTLTITMPEGKELGLNNYILITYWIEDEDGELVELEINGKTNHQYTVKNNTD